jgi:hypothetical protein
LCKVGEYTLQIYPTTTPLLLVIISTIYSICYKKKVEKKDNSRTQLPKGKPMKKGETCEGSLFVQTIPFLLCSSLCHGVNFVPFNSSVQLALFGEKSEREKENIEGKSNV